MVIHDTQCKSCGQIKMNVTHAMGEMPICDCGSTTEAWWGAGEAPSLELIMVHAFHPLHIPGIDPSDPRGGVTINTKAELKAFEEKASKQVGKELKVG